MMPPRRVIRIGAEPRRPAAARQHAVPRETVCAARRARLPAAGALLALCVWLAACSAPPPKPPSTAQAMAQAQSQNGGRALRRGDLDGALAAYTEALAAADSVEDFDAAGTQLLNLALVHARLGQTSAAHARLDRILNAPQRYSDALQGQAAARKALLLLDAGSHGIAMHWADRAHAHCPEPCPLTPAMTNLRAFIALERGELQRATGMAARSAELAEDHKLPAERANALRLQGRAQTRLGQTGPAAAALAQALAIDRELGLPERIALDLLYAGENEARRGDATAAREFFERGLQVSSAARLGALSETLRARIAGAAPAR
jgi:tetratricopeptide (TPR) repeat protein